MKKIILLISLLFIPLLVNANEYKVTSHLIDAEIEIAGGLRVQELIVVEGKTDFLSRKLNYYSFGNKKWNGKDVNLSNGTIYNGQGIVIHRVGAYEFNEKVEFGSFNNNITEYFTELDLENPKDNTYTHLDNKDGTTNLKIFYKVKEKQKIAFYINYTITNVVVNHNDIKELNYSFKNLNYNAKETFIRMIIPYPVTENTNEYNLWVHGNQSGKVQEITNSTGDKAGALATFTKIKDVVNFRITMPSTHVSVDISLNKSNIDALEEIEKIENERLNNTEKSQKVYSIMKYALTAIAALYLISSFILLKQKSKALFIIYLLFGLFIMLFNYLFKFNYWYLYIVIIIPIIMMILQKKFVK